MGMKLQPGQNAIQCRIEGTYQGKPFSFDGATSFLYGDNDGNPEDNSEFWWSEGNMSCDCNRYKYLPADFGAVEQCGDEIMIDRIIPLIEGAPEAWELHLNETERGKAS